MNKVPNTEAKFLNADAAASSPNGLEASDSAWLTTLAGASPAGIYRTNGNGECTWVNDKWTEMTGCSFDDAMGHGWQRAIHPDDFERLMAEWNGLPISGGLFCSEYRYRRPDGTVRWVLGRASEERDNEGNLLGFIGVVVDITEIRQRAAGPVRKPIAAVKKELSRRELEVARFLVEGRTNRQIAQKLGISVRTIEAHRAQLMRKLRLKSIVGLVRFAMAGGLGAK